MFNIVSRDIRTTTGSNLAFVQVASGLDPVSYGSIRIKEKISKREIVAIPENDHWRLLYLSKLLEQRQVSYYLGNADEMKDLSQLIESLCIS